LKAISIGLASVSAELSVFERVCTTDDVWEGELMPFDVAGRKILLINLEQSLHAYDASCPHQGQSLCEGTLDGHVLTCPAHHWQFDVRTGRGVNPTSCRLKSYALRVEADDVFVDVEQWVDELAEPDLAREDNGH
jgi:toluene monooxygenase system ferredoxin subunit